MSPSRMGGGTMGGTMATAALRQSAGMGLKEGFMRERVLQLEADLKAAGQREGLLETEAMQVREGELRAFLCFFPLGRFSPFHLPPPTNHPAQRSTSCAETCPPTRHASRTCRRTSCAWMWCRGWGRPRLGATTSSRRHGRRRACSRRGARRGGMRGGDGDCRYSWEVHE